ncbi:MAG: hypothetical protein KatS3mg081_1646 [Gemmatimonadales bacterium]|nr:MAG: hypothetical protein KatS3mg081_1646 [Gemmatimonadales bacterium]
MRTGTRALSLWAMVLAGLCASGPKLAAQSASIVALANVSNTALSVGWNSELDFGDVVQGVPVTVDPKTSANAGEFEIHGARRAEIQITMALPSVLTRGSFTLPISFGPNAGCHRNRKPRNACSYFDPATVLIVRIRNANPPNNTYFVWIGGTVNPSPSQPGGLYTGTITLSVSYTGN